MFFSSAADKKRTSGCNFRKCGVFLKKGTKNGGVNRNRTDLSDFADRCLTSWLPRLVMLYKITRQYDFVNSGMWKNCKKKRFLQLFPLFVRRKMPLPPSCRVFQRSGRQPKAAQVRSARQIQSGWLHLSKLPALFCRISSLQQLQWFWCG